MPPEPRPHSTSQHYYQWPGIRPRVDELEGETGAVHQDVTRLMAIQEARGGVICRSDGPTTVMQPARSSAPFPEFHRHWQCGGCSIPWSDDDMDVDWWPETVVKPAPPLPNLETPVADDEIFVMELGDPAPASAQPPALSSSNTAVENKGKRKATEPAEGMLFWSPHCANSHTHRRRRRSRTPQESQPVR